MRLLRHPRPHVTERHQGEEAEVVAGRRAGLLGVLEARLGDESGRLLQPGERLGERHDELAEIGVFHVVLDELRDRMEETAQQATGVKRHLAAHEVECLDAVGALVQLSDTCVAHELLDTVLADITVAAVNLDRGVGRGEAVIGEIRLDHRGHQRDQVVGLLAFVGVGVSLGGVELHREPDGQRAGGLVAGAHGH